MPCSCHMALRVRMQARQLSLCAVTAPDPASRTGVGMIGAQGAAVTKRSTSRSRDTLLVISHVQQLSWVTASSRTSGSGQRIREMEVRGSTVARPTGMVDCSRRGQGAEQLPLSN
eukprot:scaffold301185_cov33-Tisochrysis_lutea.AAC.1